MKTDKKAGIIFTILLCVTISVYSQKDTMKTMKDQIGIRGGFNQGFLKDQIFSNLNYTENGFLVILDYRHLKPNGNNLIESNVFFSSGKLKTNNIDFFTSSYIMANIKLAYLRKLHSHKNNKFASHLGIKYKTQIQYLDWNNQTSFSFIATHGLSIQTNIFYKIKPKHNIETALSIPVFQVLVRPPYNGIDNFITDNQNNTFKLIFTGKPTSLNKYFAINWETNFKYEISKRFELKLGYTLNYERVFETHKFTQLQNQITTGINFKF
jgi:hypothetical protein